MTMCIFIIIIIIIIFPFFFCKTQLNVHLFFKLPTYKIL